MWKYIPNVGKEQSSIWWLNGNPEGGGLGFESDIHMLHFSWGAARLHSPRKLDDILQQILFCGNTL